MRTRILLYHQVLEGNLIDELCVTVSNFRQQLNWIKDNGYRVISSHDLNRSEPSRSIEESSKTIMITFDDGYLDTYITAWPILKDFGFTATVFLVSGYMGKTSLWRKGSKAFIPLMGWSQAKEMCADNIQFGSHTLTHPRLEELSPEKAAEEIMNSRTQIEDKLGIRVNLFSYPYSSTHPNVYTILKQAKYKYAFTHRDHYVGSAGRNHYHLQRIGILASDTLDDFVAKISPNLHRRMRWVRIWLTEKLSRRIEFNRNRALNSD